MTKTNVTLLALELPVEERLELADVLWNSSTPQEEADYLAIPEWQRRILEERLAKLDADPSDGQSWEEVKAELLAAR